jgi:hypothetical protein
MGATKLVVTLLCVLFASACKSNSGNMSINAQGSASALVDGGSISDDGGTVSADGGSAQGGVLDLGQGIEVSRARIVIASLSLEGHPDAGGMSADGGNGEHREGLALPGISGQSDHSDDEGDDDRGEGNVKLGPFLIDLTGAQINGDLVQIFDADVPPGTYNEIRFVIAPVDADAGVSDQVAAMKGASVIIDGTIAEPLSDGGTFDTSFSFTSSLHATQKAEVKMTFAVDSATHNVTLTIDPRNWFNGPDGSRLDPAFAGNQAAIEDNLRRSIRARADDDHGGGDGDGHH